jgi:hypothetical protein
VIVLSFDVDMAFSAPVASAVSSFDFRV